MIMPQHNPNEVLPMLIDGQLTEGTSGENFAVFNPSTEEQVGLAPIASPQDVDAAVRSSHSAFSSWRETPAAERSMVMRKIIQCVRDNLGTLGEVLTREQGKPFPQAKGELNGFCAVLEFYAEEARRIAGMVLQSDHRDRFVYVLRQPMGVVAAIPPWNDPLHLLSRMLGPALAAGCTVVAKPSSDTPLTTLLLARLTMEAGVPAGVFNVVSGPGGRVGDGLVRHPLIRKAALTGSVDGGKQVMLAAAEGIKRVTLELGGQCPCIV
jgi:succinate-semialdehyde dehydrogenase / glutarate-semialdehyde dehydrogenase